MLQTPHKKVTFFWDENVWVLERYDLEKYTDSDALLLECFCSEKYIDELDPYGKAHIEAREAWEIAKKLTPKKLLIHHVAEIYGFERKEQLLEIKNEILEVYDGDVSVPFDWDKFDI